MANARLGWFSPLGVAASIRASARRVGLRAHCFRFSACTASEWPFGGLVLPPSASEIAARRVGLRAHASGLPLGELTFGLTASAFRHAPLRSCRSVGWPSGSRLPLFGTHRFGDCPRRVGLRAHDFRFSACAASELPSASWFFRLPLRRLPLGGLGFGLTLRGCPRRVGLRAHCFRFSARTASELPLGEFVLPPSVSELPFCGLAFGLTASAFRHAPLRGCRWAGWFLRLPFRKLPSAGWPSGSPLPLFGTHRFGVALGGLILPPSASEIALGGLAFRLTASAFRRAPLRRLPSAGWPSGSRLPLFGLRRFGDCRSASWPSGSRLPLFGMRRSAPPYRRSEGRRNTPTRHLFHFKTLIPTC